MATVTGLTAERMAEIEAATVVGGEVVGDNLILTKHDASTIDAGNVRGPAGEVGDVGPAFATPVTISPPDSPGGDIPTGLDVIQGYTATPGAQPIARFVDSTEIFGLFISGFGRVIVTAKSTGTSVAFRVSTEEVNLFDINTDGTITARNTSGGQRMRLDPDGTLHLKAGSVIAYDL